MDKINTNEFLKHLSSLIKVESTRDLSTKDVDAPFGKNIRQSMDTFLSIAKDLGFRTKDVDGYAVYAEIGPENKDYIGVLGHLDIVEANKKLWDSDPFELTIIGDDMFARGINDDKGPLLGSLYAAKYVADHYELKYPIRVIAGGAEETTWECMDYYFKKEKQPLAAFSPDGNFPIVNGEKGILHLALTFPKTSDLTFTSKEQNMFNCSEIKINDKTYTSGKELSRNPQRTDHAIFHGLKGFESDEPVVKFIQNYLMDDVYGEKLGIDKTDPQMERVSVCIMSLNTIENMHKLHIDIRYHKSMNDKKILEKFKNYDYEITRQRDYLFVDENSKLIQDLKKAYFKVMNEEAICLTKGGASYARVLENGVAFGATFEGENPRPHMPNETMKLSSLLKAIDIYIESLINLSEGVQKLPQ